MSKNKGKTAEELLQEALVPVEEQPFKVPDNWVWVRLKYINNGLRRGIEPSKYHDEIFELYSVPSFANSSPEFLLGKEISSNKQLVEENDILICKINPRINRVWIVNQKNKYKQIASTEWIVVSNHRIYPRYLMHLFRSPYFRSLLTSNVSGVGGSLTRARPNDVGKYPVAIPPFNEQKRIADKVERLLDKVNQAKQLIEEAKETFELRRAAILDKAFRGELTTNWRKENLELSPSNKELVFVTKGSSDFPHDLPRGWRWVKLNELGTLERGRSKHRPRNDPKLFGGEYPFIQTGDVAGSETYIEEYTQTLSEIGLAQSRQFPENTVCITIAANIADTAILKFPCCFPDSVVGFVVNNNSISPEYVHYFFTTIKADLEHYAPATAQKNINLKVLREIVVPVPPKEEQDVIMNMLQSLFSKEDTILSQINMSDDINNLVNSVLSKAFRGELGTNESVDESAASLLIKCLQE